MIELLYKILVIGDVGTGKTSVIRRYVKDLFTTDYRATIGIDFGIKIINLNENTRIRIQVWDLEGQDRTRRLSHVYYKGAVGCVIVFDAMRASTLESVVTWKQDLDNKVRLHDGHPLPCVLLANKVDDRRSDKITDTGHRDMQELCNQLGIIACFESSAKENINIDDAFVFLINKVLETDTATELQCGDGNPSRIRLRSDKDYDYSGSCCK